MCSQAMKCGALFPAHPEHIMFLHKEINRWPDMSVRHAHCLVESFSRRFLHCLFYRLLAEFTLFRLYAARSFIAASIALSATATASTRLVHYLLDLVAADAIADLALMIR
jgi:hypothetical protein